MRIACVFEARRARRRGLAACPQFGSLTKRGAGDRSQRKLLSPRAARLPPQPADLDVISQHEQYHRPWLLVLLLVVQLHPCHGQPEEAPICALRV